jgi:O-antigen/teichoic acid export membrane protein
MSEKKDRLSAEGPQDPDEAVDPAAPALPSALPSVGHQTAVSVLWLTGQKWVLRLSGLVTIAVLTRLLSPADFGAVAAASTVLPFFSLVADLGFAAYIVQAEKTDRRMLSTAFWYSAIAGILLTGALVAAAPLLGGVFGGDVVPVLQVLSLSLLLTAIGSVPNALLRRSMRFSAIAGQGAVAAVLAQVVAIVMAVLGFGVWALVAQTLISAVAGVVLAWVAARWLPSAQFSLREFLLMARFGGQVLGVEFIAMLRTWAEAAIISSVLGISALGYLSIAQRLVLIIQELTGGALVPVTTVSFARVRENGTRLRDAYARALRFVYATMSLPLTMLAVAAPLIIPIVFGKGWEQSYQVAQILALAATLTVGAALDHGLYYGVGKPGAWFVYAVVIDALTVGVTALTASSGLTAVALGFLGVAFIATVVRWFFVPRMLKAGLSVVLRPFGFLVVAVLLSGGAGLLTMYATSGWPDLLSAITVCSVIAVVHLLTVRILAPSVLNEALAFAGRTRAGKRIAGRLTFLRRRDAAPSGAISEDDEDER